jgi:MYXO-CTERM domain-containing protein
MATAQTVVAPSDAAAQEQDFITRVGDVSFATTVQTVWVNATQCDTESSVELEVQLGGTGSLSQVFVWVGGGAANCQTRESRNGANPTCSQVGNGPKLLEANRVITFPLSELTGTGNGRVNCGGSPPQGDPYKLFVFRTNPGDNEVPASDYGTAPFTVDVSAPDPVVINSPGPLSGSRFTVSWEQPTDFQFLDGYYYYQNEVDDAATATEIPGSSGNQSTTSVTISAADLGLAEGESAFIYVQAVDMALNIGELSSPGVEAIYIPSGGFCEATGECGCSASPRSTGSTQRSLWGFVTLLLAGVLLLRRRFTR